MFATWLHERVPQENTKESINSILNIELFLNHTELELGVLGIVRKLVKNVIQLWWWNYLI
jgi:hypothetical protein